LQPIKYKDGSETSYDVRRRISSGTRPPRIYFYPGIFTEEQLFLRQSVRDFIRLEIEPRFFEIESEAGLALAPGLLDKAAALGFTGIGVPEEYGG